MTRIDPSRQVSIVAFTENVVIGQKEPNIHKDVRKKNATTHAPCGVFIRHCLFPMKHAWWTLIKSHPSYAFR